MSGNTEHLKTKGKFVKKISKELFLQVLFFQKCRRGKSAGQGKRVGSVKM